MVNLFQNDQYILNKPNFYQFKKRFGDKAPSDEFISNAYKDFLISIRKEYPNTNIICVLGNMEITKKDSKWPAIVTSAIERLKDNNIYYTFIPYKKTPGHPKIEEQKIIADSLISFINRNDLINKY